MLVHGAILALLTAGGMYLLYDALPPKLQVWIEQHTLFARIGCALLVYTLLGASVTALFGAAILDLLIGILLAIKKNPETAAAASHLMKQLGNARKSAINYLTKAISGLNIQAPIEVK